jgi:hypothetical protein
VASRPGARCTLGRSGWGRLAESCVVLQLVSYQLSAISYQLSAIRYQISTIRQTPNRPIAQSANQSIHLEPRAPSVSSLSHPCRHGDGPRGGRHSCAPEAADSPTATWPGLHRDHHPGPDTLHIPAAYLELTACPHISETNLDLSIMFPEDRGYQVFTGTGPEDPRRWDESLDISWRGMNAIEIEYGPDVVFVDRSDSVNSVVVCYTPVARSGT